MAASSVLVQAKTVIYPSVKRATTKARELAEPVRVRLNAPLVGPRRFGTFREYRTWKAQRAARPPIWNALQWPLGVWFLIGVALTAWVKSVLT